MAICAGSGETVARGRQIGHGAQKGSKDFGKFRETRTFRFLNLGASLKKEVEKMGMTVQVDSLDIKKDPNMDPRKYMIDG